MGVFYLQRGSNIVIGGYSTPIIGAYAIAAVAINSTA